MKVILPGLCFLMTILLGAGCATTQRSDFLNSGEKLHPGKYVGKWWAADHIKKSTLARIYIEPVDVSRIKDTPEVSIEDASNFVARVVVSQIPALIHSTVVDQPAAATARVALAITYMTPGSVNGRAWASEIGVGHAYAQLDGKVFDTATGREIACFEDREGDSGAIGLEDLKGDAGRPMVKHMLESISLNFVKELAASPASP